jgi:hypothetical protein
MNNDDYLKMYNEAFASSNDIPNLIALDNRGDFEFREEDNKHIHLLLGGGAASRAGVGVATLNDGVKVEPDWRKRGKMYPDVIGCDRDVGTNDIDDDIPDLIPIDESSDDEFDDNLLSCRAILQFHQIYKHESALPLKNTCDLTDGDYDERNDKQGKIESGVKEKFIRLLDGGAASDGAGGAAARLNDGVRMEADCRKKGNMYHGVIGYDLGNSTYDIDYYSKMKFAEDQCSLDFSTSYDDMNCEKPRFGIPPAKKPKEMHEDNVNYNSCTNNTVRFSHYWLMIPFFINKYSEYFYCLYQDYQDLKSPNLNPNSNPNHNRDPVPNPNPNPSLN